MSKLEGRKGNESITQRLTLRMIVITLKAMTARCGTSDPWTRLDKQRPNVQDR